MAQVEERPSGGGDDENGKYPIGFRFKPTTEELVEFYLLPRLLGEPTVPNEFVIEADAYEFEPEILTEKYKESGVDDTWYFLSRRNRKYPGGDRPVRRTADDRGRWKPSTGQSKPPEEEDASTSHSKAKKKQAAAASFSENTLAYYVGPTRDETKTKWLMHELVVPETPDNGFRGKSAAAAAVEPSDGKLLNRYVVCRIYKSPLRKWKEIEEAAAAAAEEVPTSSSEPSGPAPERVGEAAALAPSSSRQPPAKRTAVERPAASEHTGAPDKGSSQLTTLFPGGGRSAAPTRGNGGVSSVRMPVAGAGAGATGHHGQPGLPTLVHWRPLVYNSMQGAVQTQQRPLGNRAAGMPNASGQAAPGQGPPVLRLRPPHRAAPSSQGPAMMTRPPHLAADQPAPRQQQQQQQPTTTTTETEEAFWNRVYARLIAEMKLQKAEKDNAARSGQQRISQAASAKPACVHCVDGDRPGGVQGMVPRPPAQFPAPPPAQFPAPHGGHTYGGSNSLAQRPQQQQSSSAAVEKAPAAAENVPSKHQPVPAGANEGSCKGDAATATVADNIILQILAADWAAMEN